MPTAGSGVTQGERWGVRAADWADLVEATALPAYEAVFDAVGMSGKTLLDVGCGSGMALQVAASRGAAVTGLDASAGLLEIARRRVPTAALHEGEMESMPFPAASFDVVTGFNSFQYAERPVAALAEARRVARPGGAVIILTFGRPEDCQTEGYLAALGALMPPAPPGTEGPFALSAPGKLEALAREAGLTPIGAHDVSCPWIFPDLPTALRGLMSTGRAIAAIRRSGESAVLDAVTASIAPFRAADGHYRLETTFRYLESRA